MAKTITSTTNTQIIVPDDPLGAVAKAVHAVDTLVDMENQAAANAQGLAKQLGYDGLLSIGTLEDEIRFYQRRTVEACLELGKRLLILKELTPRGEFEQRVALLGMGSRMSQQFMSATLKFSKAQSTALLGVVDTQSKLLELLILDDGEIEALENGGTVRGINLDIIETMSVSELKKALRESKDSMQSKDNIIALKSQELDKKAEQIENLERKQRTMPVDELVLQARNYLQAVSASVKASVMTELRKAIKDLHEQPGNHQTIAAACLIEIGRELAILRDEYQLPATASENLLPEWLTDDQLAEIEGMGGTPLPSVTTFLADQE